MLSLSRAGGVPLSHVDLGPTVAELQRILGQVLPPSVDLRVSVPPGLTAWTNGAFLQSALLNLALNARDAMPEGGVLTIRAEPIRWEPHVTPLAVGQLPSMDCVDLSVCDTGSGIAPGLMARIFDPLFSTKAKQRGHGLGLFMVEEFVTRSGAGLAVESELQSRHPLPAAAAPRGNRRASWWRRGARIDSGIDDRIRSRAAHVPGKRHASRAARRSAGAGGGRRPACAGIGCPASGT